MRLNISILMPQTMIISITNFLFENEYVNSNGKTGRKLMVLVEASGNELNS